MKVVVVGAGIVGASIAYHLSCKGAKVEIIEAVRPGFGASSATFAYLNAVRFSGAYAEFRLAAVHYWSELAAAVEAEQQLHRDGSIFITDTEADAVQLERHVAASSAAGLKCERWSAADIVEKLEPDLILPETDYPVVRMPEEGRLEPVPMIGRLLSGARDHGAALSTSEAVTHITQSGDRVRIATSLRVLDADHAVICAGPMAGTLLQDSGIPLSVKAQPGVTLVTRPLPARLRHVVYTRKVHFKPDGGGRILAGRTDYRTHMPTADEARDYARETASLVEPWVRNFGDDEVESVRIGVRPIPGDGFPIAGRIPGMPNLSVAVMHSGISLAGLVGNLLAHEIVDDQDDPRLAPYRPQRFFDGEAKLRDRFAPWAPGDEVVTTA